MTHLLRPFRSPAFRFGAALPAIAVSVLAIGLTAGCSSSSSSSSSSAAAPSSSAGGAAVVAPGGPAQPAGDAVYFAEGGNVRGTTAHKPSCKTACALSGDSTALLSDMTWSTWTGTKAVGHGTEKLDDCLPSCAGGKVYPVKVTVTFARPVHVCADGTSHWYWTRASFAWPDGLPSALKSDGGPANPLVYSGLASQSRSCAA